MTCSDRNFYLPRPAQPGKEQNPDIYKELGELPLIISVDNDDMQKIKHDNTLLLKTNSNYQREKCKEKGYMWGCYDKETEVLTDKGWKYFKDLDKTEKVATLNIEKNQVEYHYPDKYYCYDYNGIMIHEQGKRLDLLVTPNHRMLIKKGHHQQNSPNKYHFIEADKLPNSDVMYRKDFPYNNSNNPEYFLLPELISKKQLRTYYWAEKKIKMEYWLNFLGWFISEGCTTEYKGNYITGISQVKKENLSKIRRCLEKCGFSFYEAKQRNGVTFRIHDKQLWIYLKQLGKAHDKYIPREFLNLNKLYLKILFESLILGDGCISGKSFEYYTSSLRLANDVFELGLRLGYSPALSVRKRFYKSIAGHECNKLLTNYKIHFNRTDYTVIQKKIRKQIQYKGKIYCIEITNHNVYVRRNGKGCWCGNSLTGIFALTLASYLMNYEGTIYLLGYDWSKNTEQTHYYKDIKHRGIGYTNYYKNHDPHNHFKYFILIVIIIVPVLYKM